MTSIVRYLSFLKKNP